MSSFAQAVDGALAPADALRRGLYARLGPLRRLLVDRELRVALGGLGTALSAAALALLCPLWALALGPVLLGVPHLLSDVRYLVTRPALHRRRALWLAAGLPLLAATLWPPVPELLVGFAFAQAVHYGLWLRLVPDDDRARPTPRSFRASWATLRADLGGPALALLGALALGVAAWGAVDLTHARDGYLRLAACHAYLELAALALAWVEGRRPGAGCEAPPAGGALA